jgi:predicted PilT family ATPase
MLVVTADWSLAGETVEVLVDGAPLFEADVGAKGAIRIARRSPAGRQLEDALRSGAAVTLRRA